MTMENIIKMKKQETSFNMLYDKYVNQDEY